MARRGLLLDRDGTIIVDHGYVGSVDRVQLIPGAAEAIASFNDAQIPVVVVTNQSGVARGFYTAQDVESVHQYIAEQLKHYGAHIDLFLFCPSLEGPDRKPNSGMAQKAAEALDLDLTSSWMVGDRPEDISFAKAIGASAVFLGTWPFLTLASAAKFILHQMLAA